mmetsp:Transcript_54208/g.155815  ORF Transcript_54208/g.155815 Transcript_54208/m.155815 type:complete len:207 (+) Transcript_54208:1003-1623(+)
MPRVLSKAWMAFLPASGLSSMVRWRRATASKATRGASFSSASASMASMASALLAMALARRRLTPCWAKRMVLAEFLSLTVVCTMLMAWVRTWISSARICERWSQVLAFPTHIFESSVAYSLSSIRFAATVESLWLAAAMSAMAFSLSFLAFSSFVVSSLMRSVFSCMNLSCKLTASTSASSTLVRSARKSFSRPSRVSMTESDLNL